MSGLTFQGTVEGHLRNLGDCRLGKPIRIHTETVGADERRLHIYQYVIDVNRDIVLATSEHMMIHVDTERRRAIPVGNYMRVDCRVQWKSGGRSKCQRIARIHRYVEPATGS